MGNYLWKNSKKMGKFHFLDISEKISGEKGKLPFSQSGALRHLALNRLHGEQCKCHEPLGDIGRQVQELKKNQIQIQIQMASNASVMIDEPVGDIRLQLQKMCNSVFAPHQVDGINQREIFIKKHFKI